MQIVRTCQNESKQRKFNNTADNQRPQDRNAKKRNTNKGYSRREEKKKNGKRKGCIDISRVNQTKTGD